MNEQKATTAITGYRQLSATETALINKVKAHAETTKELLGEVQKLNSVRFAQSKLMPVPDEVLSTMTADSNRWLAVAKTQLQQGYMALNRAVALPTTF